jgi:hypothetical protein
MTGLMTVALILFALFTYYRIHPVFFVLLLTLVLRSSTDLLIFFGPFDFLPLFFIFYLLKRSTVRVFHLKFASSGIQAHGSPGCK